MSDELLDSARVREVVSDGSGIWQSCTGCYEGSDGQNVHGYPFSNVFGCVLGNGCSECGGIGAVWDQTDYADFAEYTRAPSSNEALLREALEKCADDLEAELKARWCFEPDGSCHPALQHKFDRDMVVVNDARKLLAKIDAVLNTVDEPGTREPE